MAKNHTPDRQDVEGLNSAVSLADRGRHNIDTLGIAQHLMQPGSITSATPGDLVNLGSNDLSGLANQSLRARLAYGYPTVAAIHPSFVASFQDRFRFDSEYGVLYLGAAPVDPHLLIPGADHGEMLVEQLAASGHLAQLLNNFLGYQARLHPAPRNPNNTDDGADGWAAVKTAMAIVAACAALVVGGAIVWKNVSHADNGAGPGHGAAPTVPHIPDREPPMPRPRPRPDSDRDGTREQVGETLGKPNNQPQGGDAKVEVQGEQLTSFETVLFHSLERVDPNTNTYKDGLLNSYSVAKNFLGGKFIYRGRHVDEKALAGSNNQRIHRFAVIGSKSGFYRNKNEKKLNTSTTIVDAINDILDVENLSDQTIKDWLVWTYYHSFGANLSAADLKIERSEGEITGVTYGATHPKVIIKERANVEGRAVGAQNSTQEIMMKWAIVDAKGNLVLPSGMTSLDGRGSHDLLVPSNLLPSDQEFTLTFDGAGHGSNFSWPIKASDLANETQAYLARKANGRPRVSGIINGTTVNMSSTRQTVNLTDGYADSLAFVLTKGSTSKLDEAGRLARFIQSRKYISEIGGDEDRPLIMILFNSGGDCNNKLVPWTSMMARRKLDFAVIYLIDPKSDKYESHVVGGVGQNVFPNGKIPANLSQVAGFAPIELTLEGWAIGNGDTFGKFAIVGMDGYAFTPDATGTGGTWTITAWQNSGKGTLQGSVASTVHVPN